MRAMRRIRRIGVGVFLAFSVAVGWLLWVKPKQVDMAQYAPADSIIYLESNHPLDIAQTIAGTDVWKGLDKLAGYKDTSRRSDWLQRFVGWTGIGPAQSVILARAQLAIVVTQLGTREEGDTLRIRPEGAAIIETHTAESRIRSPAEQALEALAKMTYRDPTLRRTTIDGVEFIEWISPEGGRQIVAAILGSLIIVGNSEAAVQKCLDVTLHRRPSLQQDSELQRTRVQLVRDQSLTFGYAPAGNSARLLSVAVPLMLGRAAGDSQFERLITSSAPKVLGSVGWSSNPYMNGVEDHYLISLQATIVARLKPSFDPGKVNPQVQRLMPADLHSVTYYKFGSPVAAWQNLKTAISSQIDTLSAIVFSSLLKSALLAYGIQEPEKFLAAVSGDVLTMRLDEGGERALLIARVRDSASLRELLIGKMLKNVRSVRVGDAEILENSDAEMAVGFINEYVVLGHPLDVRRCADNAIANVGLSNDKLRKITFFTPLSTPANIVTYTNDADRVRSFISAVVALGGAKALSSADIEQMIESLPYSATETTLVDWNGQRALHWDNSARFFHCWSLNNPPQ
jgi:hypothetical protein